jgi:hypothetical protein
MCGKDGGRAVRASIVALVTAPIMPTETSDKPHPTPHPDQPQDAGPECAWSPQPDAERSERQATDRESPAHQSCFDDVDVTRSQSVAAPDAQLQSNTPASTDEAAHVPASDVAVGPVPADQGKQPGTAEVFRNLAPAGSDSPSTAWAPRPLAAPAAGGAVAKSALAGGAHRPAVGHEREPDGDDDHALDIRVSWLIGLLLSYSSAVTLALAWVLWTGGPNRSADEPAAGPSRAGVEPAVKPAESATSVSAPAIPDENLTSLGKPVRIGALEVTPLQVVAAPVQLVRSIDSSDVRDGESESLMLRFKVTNISSDLVFAPLEAALVREQASALDRSYIATARGKRINLFPLAIDSEWRIAGQSFPVLNPGESSETLLASEPLASGRPTGDLIWRIRLRIGPYRSDLFGVRFSAQDITP